MNKPVVVAGSLATAALVGAVAVVSTLQKPPATVPPPVPACEELRGYMEREFQMRLREERRRILKDAAEVVKGGLLKHKARNPKADAPPEVVELMHGLELRAKE